MSRCVGDPESRVDGEIFTICSSLVLVLVLLLLEWTEDCDSLLGNDAFRYGDVLLEAVGPGS